MIIVFYLMSLLNNLIQYNFFNNQVFNFLIELMVANHVVIKKRQY